jgi:hypothetical protein
MKTTQKISNKTEIKPSTTIRISKVESARNKLIRDVTIKQYLFTVKAGLLLLGLFAGPGAEFLCLQ